ncbi:hypothetical protein QQP08_010960 [Theobroma cacao]|nr:hypothetical protein QQP08_010960 [Theobroma cacao]
MVHTCLRQTSDPVKCTQNEASGLGHLMFHLLNLEMPQNLRGSENVKTSQGLMIVTQHWTRSELRRLMLSSSSYPSLAACECSSRKGPLSQVGFWRSEYEERCGLACLLDFTLATQFFIITITATNR